MRRLVMVVAVAVGAAGVASAQFWGGERSGHGKRGQGAIVVRDDAPVYEDKSSMEVKEKLKRGASVVGMHMEAKIIAQYELIEENGRYRVMWPNPDSAKPLSGWMDPEDLASFTYDCGCEDNCMPWRAGFGPGKWNLCFKEARDEKLEKLRDRWSRKNSANED